MSKISKWTLSIKDRSISPEWQTYCEKNVMKIMPPCLIIHVVFLLSNLTGLFTDKLLVVPRIALSGTSVIISTSLWFLSKTTGKFFFMRCFPAIFLIYHFVTSNAFIYYALSDQGTEAGREEFGNDHPIKLRQLTYTFKDNLLTIYGVTITLLSPSWFWYSIVASIGYFCSQNYLHYQINKSEMEGDLDSTILSFTAV